MALEPKDSADPSIKLAPNFKSNFLSGLTAAELKMVLASAQRRRFSVNQVMLQAGDVPATHFYLLLTGRAKYCMITEEGQDVMLRWLNPGDVFGVGTLTPVRGPNLMNVQAVRDGTALVWDGDTIRDLAGRFPRLFQNAFTIVAGFLAEYVERNIKLANQSAQQRVAGALLQLTRQAGHPHPEGVEIDVTNDELAAMANVTGFTVSRILSAWEPQGTVTKSRGKIVVRSPEHIVARLA
jgi:CRP-like cAMP-binding protein